MENIRKPHSSDKIKKIINWTEDDVNKWKIYVVGLELGDIELDGFNGKYLHELYQYQKQTPELFYKIVKPILQGVIRDAPIALEFIKFSYALKALFEN